MLNYMRAELYKALRRKYIYIAMGVILVLAALLVWSWWFTNSHGNHLDFSFTVGSLAMLLNVGLYAPIVVGDIVFSEQYKHNTLKNEVSYGISRTRIYLGKLFVQWIVAVVCCLIILCFYVGLCWIVMPHGSGVSDTMAVLGYCLLCALPLWLGAQSLTNAVYFNIRSNNIAAIILAAFLAGGHQILKLLGILISDVFMRAYQVMLPTPFETIAGGVIDWGFFGYCLVVGAAWIAVSTVVGLVLFRKKEIN